MQRDSTIIYRSFYEAIKELPKDQQADAWDAVFKYALDFKEPELTGMVKMVFTLIKPQLDANIKRYKSGVENGSKGAIHGKKGGRPRKEKPSPKPPNNPHQNPQITLTEPSNDNVNDNHNGNVNGNKNENNNPSPKYKDYIPAAVQVGELKERILKDTIWHGTTVFNIKGVNQNTLPAYLDDFTAHLLKESELETEFPYKDKRQHFFNWLKKYAENNPKGGKSQYSFI